MPFEVELKIHSEVVSLCRHEAVIVAQRCPEAFILQCHMCGSAGISYIIITGLCPAWAFYNELPLSCSHWSCLRSTPVSRLFDLLLISDRQILSDWKFCLSYFSKCSMYLVSWGGFRWDHRGQRKPSAGRFMFLCHQQVSTRSRNRKWRHPDAAPE